MQVIPSIDLTKDRSRLVWWPGASAGQGTPTDRPDRIAKAFVELGAPAIHLVDMDGPGQGRPVNLSAISAVSRAVAVPLQLAGGVDGPEQIELAFAAGATPPRGRSAWRRASGARETGWRSAWTRARTASRSTPGSGSCRQRSRSSSRSSWRQA
jgi:hypothetical protein